MLQPGAGSSLHQEKPGVQQLAQLYGAVQSGGALAALGALQQQPREQQPEIYALTTGNKFEVTPVFDPVGPGAALQV